MPRWPVAGPSGYWLLAGNPATKSHTFIKTWNSILILHTWLFNSITDWSTVRVLQVSCNWRECQVSLVKGRLDWCYDAWTVLLSVRRDLLLSLTVSWSWYRFLCGHQTCVTTLGCIYGTSTNPPRRHHEHSSCWLTCTGRALCMLLFTFSFLNI